MVRMPIGQVDTSKTDSVFTAHTQTQTRHVGTGAYQHLAYARVLLSIDDKHFVYHYDHLAQGAHMSARGARSTRGATAAAPGTPPAPHLAAMLQAPV